MAMSPAACANSACHCLLNVANGSVGVWEARMGVGVHVGPRMLTWANEMEVVGQGLPLTFMWCMGAETRIVHK